MFGGQSFYHQLLTKYVTVFGACFADVVIKRTADGLSTGTVTQDIKVPLQYASKDKMQVKILADPNLDKETAINLPVISFEIPSGGTMSYAADRKVTSLQRKVTKITDNKNAFNLLYTPVPYDIYFNVYVYVKNAEDGNKIIEQILPFFTPDYTLSVELVPEMSETRDIPIVLRSVSMEDKNEGDFKDRRILVWTLSFVMHAWFFGPVKQKPMVKLITLNTRLSNQPVSDVATGFPEISNTNPIVEITTIRPGLTANGQPTTDINETIDYHLIAVDDAWGYIVDTNVANTA